MQKHTIPNSVTSIGSYAFLRCSGLTSVTIPNSVTYIGYHAFDGTPFRNNMADGVIYLGKCLYKYKGTMPENTRFVIENGTTCICDYAFRDCSGLTSVTIPNSVSTIYFNPFSRCLGLTSVKVESGNAHYDSRNNCNAIIESSTNTLICGCKNTTIPNSVTSIGDFAFRNCSGLTSVTIPNSVTYIGGNAFLRCSSITDFYCLAETIPTTGTSIFYESDISNATLHVPASAVESYSSTSPWSGFGNIVALVASDIIEDENHITFADMNVRALCMANWDTDRNGSLSYEEAAAVTDLGEVFADNTDITSFDELQYFTGLSAIDDNALWVAATLPR